MLVVGGLDESSDDFALLTDLLVLAGFAVTVFGDVSVDPDSGLGGVRAALAEVSIAAPVTVVGSDFGAVLALTLLVAERRPIDAIVIGGLVTRLSRASTVPVADFEALGGVDRAGGGADPALDGAEAVPATVSVARIPAGFRLPQPAEVRVPVLVFHGDADDVTRVADAVSWASLLPFGSLRLVPGGDHRVLTGEARRTVAAAIVLFLERQRAGRPVLVDGFASTGVRAT
ncbi:hypothetical protein C8E83_0544 [Frondihabitans australicus]|uniref:Alpha/beta hydrolase family protein n=1 Tax=Frondihabitans australicus TaxID=386892 RepID=A0A495IDQ3_9MICO|nr:hypothetical protein C8E83_0544 [Frondihabitans australicus]